MGNKIVERMGLVMTGVGAYTGYEVSTNEYPLITEVAYTSGSILALCGGLFFLWASRYMIHEPAHATSHRTNR